MHKTILITCVAITLLVGSTFAFADSASDIKALQDEKALLDAQTARDTAKATAIRAAADVAKAQAASTAKDNSIATAEYTSDAALTSAQVTAQTAELAALKTAFGTVPSIGTEGNVTISDSTGGMLLEAKSGSLRVTWELAIKFCAALPEVKGAFFAPIDLDSKILAGKFVLKEFNDIKARVAAAKTAVDGAATVQSAAVGLLSAVSLLEYGAGALQSVARLFRSDYSVALADGKRELWLEYFIAAQCPSVLPKANIESVIRGAGFDEAIASLNEIAAFADKVSRNKSAAKELLDRANQDLIDYRTKNPNTTSNALVNDQTNKQTAFNSWLQYDSLVARIKPLLDFVSSKQDAFIDSLVWTKFDESPYKTQKRIVTVFTTQDGQVTKTSWLFGKSVYGRSSGELIYRVTDSAGNVFRSGYLVATNSNGKFDFSANAPPVAEGNSAPKDLGKP